MRTLMSDRKRTKFLYLYRPLELDKSDKLDLTLWEGFAAIRERSNKLTEEDLRRRRRALNKRQRSLQTALGKVKELLENASKKELEKTVAETKSDPELMRDIREVLDMILPAAKNPAVLDEQSDDIEKREKELATDARKLKHSQRLNRMQDSVEETLRKLSKMTEIGDEKAAETLALIARSALLFLTFHTNKKPELFWGVSKSSTAWPVVGQLSPEWSKTAERTLSELHLGENTIYARFKRDKAFDKRHPARSYAVALVENIAFNKWYIPAVSSEWPGVQSLLLDDGYDFETFPSWGKEAVALPDFSLTAVEAWMAVAKKILREQQPTFHEKPEWKFVASRFEPHEKGRIQNKILDHIGSAMRTIAKP